MGTINYNNYRFGTEEFAIGNLINGDLPENDAERWNMVEAPLYRLQKVLDDILTHNLLYMNAVQQANHLFCFCAASHRKL